MLARKIEELRELGYEPLRGLCGEPAYSLFGGRLQIGGPGPRLEMTRGSSGTEYQLQIDIFPDGGLNDDSLRVMVELHEECMAYQTLSDDFIIGPSRVG